MRAFPNSDPANGDAQQSRIARFVHIRSAKTTVDLAADGPAEDSDNASKQVGAFKSTALATGILIVIGGIGFGSMAAFGEILHLLIHSRRINVLHVFHDPIAVGLLIGVAVLWIIPPHPWNSNRKRKSRSVATSTHQEVESGWTGGESANETPQQSPQNHQEIA